jgi:3-phenylpropionate/cinnamic acid dioxygenase small subunit
VIPEITLGARRGDVHPESQLVGRLRRAGRIISAQTVQHSKHLGGRGRWISEFETSLVYRVSSRTARATQRNPVSKNPPKQNKTKQNKTKQNKTPHLKEKKRKLESSTVLLRLQKQQGVHMQKKAVGSSSHTTLKIYLKMSKGVKCKDCNYKTYLKKKQQQEEFVGLGNQRKRDKLDCTKIQKRRLLLRT